MAETIVETFVGVDEYEELTEIFMEGVEDLYVEVPLKPTAQHDADYLRIYSL